ncbi:hypothetical protein BGX28_003204 [Mortierella sp. GBA30]|nr:hypothetical protein BGX28_003204 [Mortierella sp. GBA30]
MVTTTGAQSSHVLGEDTSMDTSQDNHINHTGVEEQEEPEEPEGPRMTRLRAILNKSLEETLKACNYNAIRESFPYVAAANSGELRNAHEKVCLFLRGEVNYEFGQIIEQRNIIFKLNSLDRLIADAKSKGITAGSRSILDLTPDVTVRARTVPTKEAEIERLKSEIERVQLDNRRLGSALNQSRTTQAAMKFELLESYGEFQEVASIASQMPVHDMEQLVDTALRHVTDT